MDGVSPWQNAPEANTRTSFVFLSIDVIGHSKLFHDQLSNNQLAAIHHVLEALQQFTFKNIPDGRKMMWDWASDGGIFGFPSSRLHPNTTVKVLECAIRIWKELDQFNEDCAMRELEQPIALHIAMDCGDAFYAEDREMRRGDALNVAAKLKSPSGQTEILITKRIFDNLPKTEQEKFVVIAHEDRRKPIYGYLPALQSAMRELAGKHDSAGELVEAAQCHYRLGRFHLAAKGERQKAEQAFRRAVETLAEVPKNVRAPYFFRTLTTFYEAWRRLACEPTLNLAAIYVHDETFLHNTGVHEDTFLHKTEVTELFRSSEEWKLRGNLLTHMELIFKQLDLLGDKMVNTPAGLSTLETTLLLQRMGYSSRYFGDALAKRRDRVEREVEENNGRSIDGDCSLCTGAAVSALSLGHRGKKAEILVEWLRLLKPARFCFLRRDYTDAARDEHALHYAAVALQGFIDFWATCSSEAMAAGDAAADLCAILEEFFKFDELDPHGFLQHWMRHRNIDRFEVCTYVLPVFLRYLFAGHPLSASQRKVLGQALDALAENMFIDMELSETDESPGRLYAARENIGSLALGLLIGMNPAAERIATYVMQLFSMRSHSAYFERSSLTLDSNLDRTRRFLEGWLLQWEAVLCAAERASEADQPALPEYARGLLTVYTRREDSLKWARRSVPRQKLPCGPGI